MPSSKIWILKNNGNNFCLYQLNICFRELSVIHSTDSSWDDGSGHDNESSCEEKSDKETQGTERNSPTIFDKIFSWITQSESNNSIEELKEKNESSGSSDSDSEESALSMI